MADTSKKLVYMANQIATFFASQPADQAAAGTATHINKFWDPRMRRKLFEIIDNAGDGLSPLVLEAAAQINRPKAQNAA
jgi:formate dehydrogenase subunit delta